MHKLTRKANRRMRFVTKFIQKMTYLKERALDIDYQADEEIKELKDVKKTCEQVTKFVDKIIE